MMTSKPKLRRGSVYMPTRLGRDTPGDYPEGTFLIPRSAGLTQLALVRSWLEYKNVVAVPMAWSSVRPFTDDQHDKVLALWEECLLPVFEDPDRAICLLARPQVSATNRRLVQSWFELVEKLLLGRATIRGYSMAEMAQKHAEVESDGSV